MRKEPTLIEKKISESISDYVYRDFKQKVKIDDTVTDRPDLVLITQTNKKIGVEITRLTYEKFMKWNSKGTTINHRREAQIEVDLSKQIPNILNKKNKKYKEYKKGHNLSEVWICLHNDLYEFGNNQLDKDHFCNDGRYYCWINKCKFEKVIFFSENSEEYVALYQKNELNPIAKPSSFNQIISYIEMAARMTSEGITFNEENNVLEDKKKFK